MILSLLDYFSAPSFLILWEKGPPYLFQQSTKTKQIKVYTYFSRI
jgi:hypothetical protein